MAGTNILVRQKDLIAGSGISITPDTTSGNVTIAATNTAIDESRLLPETGSVSSDSVGNPVIFKAISRIDNTYWLCLPLNEDTNDRSTYDVATEVYGTVNIVSNAPSSPGGSAFFNGSSCLHGTLPAQFGSGDFTVRFWMMAPTISSSSSSSSHTIFSTRRGNQTDADTFGLLCTTEGRLFIYSNGDITSRTDTPFTLQSNVWYHVAVVRNSGVLTIYVNGEVYNSATFTNSLTRQIFGLGASWTGSSYSEAGTVYLTSLDVLNYAAYDGAFTTPAYQPGILAGMGYAVATDSEVTDMLSAAGIDESRLIPTGGRNGNLLEYQEGVDRGNGSDVRLLLQNALTDSASGNVAPATVTAQGVTLTGDNNLLFDGNDSHVTAVLATGEIFAADKEWTIDFWMKPTANSSEWNYILTENRGDWGSHSIGLTWNKTKNALEQDTGGYVASVIKAPNWPNNSVACAAGEWHFVAVEKQKTATGWSLNYYLNGAIWLQVAFTGEFVPFSSDNPFWFGGKTTDSGRWFKGEANKLRVTAGARYGGKAFAVPDRLTDYAAPAGQPVWTEGIDRSRLLKVPTSADEGKLPVIRADKIPAVYHDTTLAAIVIEGDKVIDKISGKELTKVGSPQIIDGGIHSPTNSDYYMLELEGVEGLPVAVSFDYQGDESPDSSNIVTINGNCAYYSINGVSFCRSQGGGNNIKIDNQPVGISEAYRNYVMQVSSDNYESKTPPVAFIAGESKSPTYEGSFPAMSPLSSVKVCGRFGKIRNVLIGSAFPYTGNFTPRGDGVEGFGVPEKREPGWNYETLDEAANGRLLPENPANGDIPCFDATATVGGGNDSDTVLLIQPVTSNNQIVNQAVGGGDRVVLQNTNVMVLDTGEMTFAGNAYLSFNPNSVTSLFLKDSMPWTLDLVYNVSSKSMQCLFGRGTSPRMDFLLQSNGNLEIGSGPSLGSGWPFDTDVRLTFEVYMEGGNQKYTAFRDGTPVASGTWSVPDLHDSTLWIGWDGDTDSRKITGWIKALRMTDTATHNGAAFTPDELPWTEPQVVGEWSTINKSVLVRSVNNQTPDSSGAVTIPVATASAAGLMTATDKVKLDALQQAATYINIATDFNTYKTAGSYFLKGAAHTNGPLTDSYAGTLVVVAPAELQYVTQYFTQLYTNKTFVRTYAQDNAKWNAWNRVIVDTDIATTSAAGLMSATDREKSIGLTTRGFYPNALAKSGAVDFNEVIDHGFYFIGGDTPHLNYPETNKQTGGTLQVIRYGNYLTQTLILFDKNKSFNRSCFNANSGSSERTFSAWQRLLTDTEITESKARPGYFKLPGGTIVQWGAVLNITADGTTSVTLPIAFPHSAFVATATATGSGLIASTVFDGNSKLNVIVKGYPGSGSFTIYWIAIGY